MAVEGADAHAARLRRANSPQAIDRIGRALFKAGRLIEAEAARLITTNAVSGKHHIPSKPGQPPNENTGTLRRNIETTQPEPLVVEVQSKAPYAAALEFGTSKMAARPYMAPATNKKRAYAEAYVARVIENAIGGSNGE